MGSYRLTQAASDDLVTIFIEGLALFGLDQADRYHAGLAHAFQFLADFPRAARLREEIDPPVRAYRYRSHMIVYDLASDDAVIVLRIRHGREDWLTESDGG